MIIKRRQIKIFDTVIKLNLRETEYLNEAIEELLKDEAMLQYKTEFFLELNKELKNIINAGNKIKFKTRD